MELNRDMIVKALECCSEVSCDGCPYYPTLIGCVRLNMSNALALIRELTEENERLEAELAKRPRRLVITKVPKKEAADG